MFDVVVIMGVILWPCMCPFNKNLNDVKNKIENKKSCKKTFFNVKKNNQFKPIFATCF